MCNKVYYPFYILALAGVVILSGCKAKNDPLNPEASDLPEASFTLSAVETRGTEVQFPWRISKDGKTDSVNEEIDDMYVTLYNEVMLVVDNTAQGFKGVNITSSNTNAVVVEELTPQTYLLKYKHDGDADITVWNGKKKKSSTKITFHVNSVKEIVPKEVLFVYDEGTKREQILKARWWVTNENDFRELWEQQHYVPERRVLGREDFSISWNFNEEETEDLHPDLGYTLHTMRYLRVEPENVSCRNIKFTTNHWHNRCVSTDTWYPWLEEHGYEFDWGDFEGDFSDLKKNTYWSFSPLCSINSRMSWCEIRFMRNGVLKYATVINSSPFIHSSSN